MKKMLAMILAVVMTLAVVACGASDKETLTQTPMDLVTSLSENLQMQGAMSDVIVAEMLPFFLGVEENADISAAFTANVADSVISMPMISVHAHLVMVLKCNDFEAAKTMYDLLLNNYNVRRWVCVLPEKTFVARSGSYVVLASTNAQDANTIYNNLVTLSQENVTDYQEITDDGAGVAEDDMILG